MTERVHRCSAADGCEEATVRRYVVQDHEGRWSVVDYCGDCAALARADWNGETARCVGPFTAQGTGGNCTALVAEADGYEWMVTRAYDPTIPEPGQLYAVGRVSAETDPEDLGGGRYPAPVAAVVGVHCLVCSGVVGEPVCLMFGCSSLTHVLSGVRAVREAPPAYGRGESPLLEGDVWTIYQDPFTRRDPEGDAELIRRVGGEGEYDARSHEGTGAERWLVRFPDGDEVERLIVVPPDLF